MEPKKGRWDRASITEDGVGPCLAVEDSTTKEGFKAHLEGVLGRP